MSIEKQSIHKALTEITALNWRSHLLQSHNGQSPVSMKPSIWIGFGKHKWTRKITKQKHQVLAIDMLDARIMKGLLLKQLQA